MIIPLKVTSGSCDDEGSLARWEMVEMQGSLDWTDEEGALGRQRQVGHLTIEEDGKGCKLVVGNQLLTGKVERLAQPLLLTKKRREAPQAQAPPAPAIDFPPPTARPGTPRTPRTPGTPFGESQLSGASFSTQYVVAEPDATEVVYDIVASVERKLIFNQRPSLIITAPHDIVNA